MPPDSMSGILRGWECRVTQRLQRVNRMLFESCRWPVVVLFVFTNFAAGCREQALKSPPPSNINRDEDVLFFPTYGSLDAKAGVWRFDLHGKVYEPEDSSTKRAVLVAALRSAVDVGFDTDENPFLDDRIRAFLVDNERGKSVTIDVAGEPFAAGTSAANGHFKSSLVLGVDSVPEPNMKNPVLETKAVLRDGDSRVFVGRVHLIGPRGVSVISDLDDTIKLSQVTDKSELLQNTFLREFQPVEGMPALYANMAELDVAFHYVSGSPWQLYQPLDEFLAKVGYPKGTYHLKNFRLKDSSVQNLFSSQEETKLAAIDPLLSTFPDRKFILIGDSGEHDPEIYGQIAREHRDQIAGIFIRNVTEAKSEDERFSDAFRDVPGDRWFLFDQVSQISAQMINCAETQK